jgi:hypothetical protein
MGEDGSRRHVELGADDRLHAVAQARLVEVDRSEHHPVVGDRQGAHPVLFERFDEVGVAVRAVAQAVLGLEDRGADNVGGVRIPSGEAFHPGEVWTPELAREFFAAHSGREPAFIDSEIVRYLGMPGQAISYKLGERAWLAGREAGWLSAIERVANAAVFRYEPRSERFDIFTSYDFANPWGHVFDRWGQNFIADASHELRTPLTVLRANAEVGLEIDRASVQAEFLEEIVRESERMTHLVEDMLFLARSDSGSLPLQIEAVDLEPFLAELAERAHVLAGERDRELVGIAPPTPLAAFHCPGVALHRIAGPHSQRGSRGHVGGGHSPPLDPGDPPLPPASSSHVSSSGSPPPGGYL